MPKKHQKSKQDRTELLQFFTVFEKDFYNKNDPNHKEKIGRDKRGRPTVMTRQALAKLRTAFMIGCTDKEACIYAGLSEDMLYAFCKKHSEFREEKEDLKENPVIYSRLAIVDAIANRRSVGDAWEYLKRKRKDEFSELKKIEHANVVPAKDLEEPNNGDVEVLEEDDDAGEADDEQLFSKVRWYRF